MIKNKFLIIISHYNERDKSKHFVSTSLLKKQNYDLFIVINDDVCQSEIVNTFKDTKLLSRQNFGVTGQGKKIKWNASWDVISKFGLNYLIGYEINNKPFCRIQHYLHLLNKWFIEIGEISWHLRYLIRVFIKITLDKVSTFPIGNNKEEWITSTILVSKKVQQLKLKVNQINENNFNYISHIDSKLSGTNKA